MKIEWSNRAHFFTKKELGYLNHFLEKSQNLTQGNELLKFENGLKKYLKVKNVYALSSAAAALESFAKAEFDKVMSCNSQSLRPE